MNLKQLAMIFLNRIIWGFVGLLLFLFLAVGTYALYQQPKYKGEVKLSGIVKKVIVFYDAIGVPHIEAENQEDAYIALGYVHAQDRLWQMELLRRISAGRLSELFGEKTIEVDRFFKSLGIEEAAEKTIQNLDTMSPSYVLTNAYLKGINEYIKKNKTPFEFHVFGLDKEFYEIKDVYNVFGYMAFSFAMAHKTDPMLSSLKSKLGETYLRDLPIEIDTTKMGINRPDILQSHTNYAADIIAVLKQLPVPTLVGSNSWVLGPEKTKNGKVIFENDPHIGFSQPAVWYQAHLKTPDFESYGFHLGLTPFPMLAHNRYYAYGITMFENDDIDFYIEKPHPTNKYKYIYKGEELYYEISDKVLQVKGAEPLFFKVKETIHGPIMNNVVSQIESESPISMAWVYTRFENKLLEASYGMSHATSIDSFQNAVNLIHAPGLNMMYGDLDGNIAWWAAAKLMEHTNSVNPKFVLNGTEGKDDKLVEVDFLDNPQSLNPPSNYVYSANNQSFALVHQDGDEIQKGYHGYYLPEDRGRRIVELLSDKTDITHQDMMDMTLDVTSSTAKEFISFFPIDTLLNSHSENVVTACRLLKNWNADFTTESVAATIYMKLIYVYLEETLKDEMGDSLFDQFLNTHVQKRTINHLIGNRNSIWWDKVTTNEVFETREDILNLVFNKAITDLEEQLGTNIENWKWAKVHTVEHEHPLGAVALFKPFLNIGPFGTHGANEVLNNLQYEINASGLYKVKSGPSTRRVIDFSDIENSKAIIPTGQSGNPFSKFYKNQSKKYLSGEFVPMLLNHKEIRNSKDILIFEPK
jgi:penicillin G amidase